MATRARGRQAQPLTLPLHDASLRDRQRRQGHDHHRQGVARTATGKADLRRQRQGLRRAASRPRPSRPAPAVPRASRSSRPSPAPSSSPPARPAASPARLKVYGGVLSIVTSRPGPARSAGPGSRPVRSEVRSGSRSRRPRSPRSRPTERRPPSGSAPATARWRAAGAGGDGAGGGHRERDGAEVGAVVEVAQLPAQLLDLTLHLRQLVLDQDRAQRSWSPCASARSSTRRWAWRFTSRALRSISWRVTSSPPSVDDRTLPSCLSSVTADSNAPAGTRTRSWPSASGDDCWLELWT